MKKPTMLEKIFIIYLCLIPVLEYYNSPVFVVNFSTFLAILFGLLFLMGKILHRTYTRKSILVVSLVYVCFIIINTFLTLFLYKYNFKWNNFSSLFRLIVLFGCVIFLGSPHFSFEYAKKALRFIICTASIIIIIQFLLKNTIRFNFRPILTRLLRDKGYADAGTRFSGFYMEPAHFAYSATLYLVLEIFSSSYHKKKTPFILITVVGVILSGSGQGYLFLAMIFAFWFLKMFYLSKKNANYLFIASGVTLLLAAVCLIAFQIPYVQNSLHRLTSDNNTFGGIALDGRISTKVFFETLSKEKKLIGIGFGHVGDLTDLFVSSLYTHLIECGYFSIPFLILLVLPSLFQKRYYKLILSVFFGLTVFFASGANPATLTFFLPFLYLDKQPFENLAINNNLIRNNLTIVFSTEQ